VTREANNKLADSVWEMISTVGNLDYGVNSTMAHPISSKNEYQAFAAQRDHRL
jgi:hypothetical protein